VYLDPNAAHAAVERLARETGDPFPLRRYELVRRLAERRLLASREADRGRHTIRVTVQGERMDVLHLFRATLYAETPSQPSQPSHDVPDSASGRHLSDSAAGTVDNQDGDDRPTDRPTTGTAMAPLLTFGTVDGTLISSNGANRPTLDGAKTGVLTPFVPGPGTVGTVGTAFAPLQGPVCRYDDHTDFRVGRDRQWICNDCHPDPVQLKAREALP